MTDHPSLQPVIEAWKHSVESISELVTPLSEGEWNRATECPGWSVRDVVSHVIGVECELLGDPRPIHTLPSDLYHVQSDLSRFMEIQVDVRRHHTGPEMTSELEYTLIRRNRQLRDEQRDPETKVPSNLPGQPETTLLQQLTTRVLDVWVHEQDIRRALGKPGDLDSPGALLTRDEFVRALPVIVAKRAGAPAESAVVLDVSGPVEFMQTVRVDKEGHATVDASPSLGPLATLSLDWETYTRLACGRVRPAAVAEHIKIEGDTALGDAILANFAVTP